MTEQEPIDDFTRAVIAAAPKWTEQPYRQTFMLAARAVHLLQYSAHELEAFDRAGYLSALDRDVLQMMRRTVVGE